MNSKQFLNLAEKIIDGSRRSKKFNDLYLCLLDQEHPQEFNYAMIDLGACVCLAGNPRCGFCPVSSMCMYSLNH